MVTPLTVTTAWLREYFRLRDAGKGEREARTGADHATEVTGKQFARCRISTGTLTVPVEGGASTLKRRGAEPVLSEHGKWRREHLGAWNAAYGRTAYYEHLMPEIAAVYATSEGITLEEFNTRLLDVALGWLDHDSLREHEGRLKGIRAEVSAKADEGLSIFDVLFRLGKEGVFAI